MIICEKCSFHLADSSNFCTNCGNMIKKIQKNNNMNFQNNPFNSPIRPLVNPSPVVNTNMNNTYGNQDQPFVNYNNMNNQPNNNFNTYGGHQTQPFVNPNNNVNLNNNQHGFNQPNNFNSYNTQAQPFVNPNNNVNLNNQNGFNQPNNFNSYNTQAQPFVNNTNKINNTQVNKSNLNYVTPNNSVSNKVATQDDSTLIALLIFFISFFPILGPIIGYYTYSKFKKSSPIISNFAAAGGTFGMIFTIIFLVSI